MNAAAWGLPKVEPYNTGQEAFYNDIDREAGEVSDGDEPREERKVSTSEVRSTSRRDGKESDAGRMFPVQRSLLDGNEPLPDEHKRPRTLSKYANLGWGDMVTRRPNAGVDRPPPSPPPMMMRRPSPDHAFDYDEFGEDHVRDRPRPYREKPNTSTIHQNMSPAMLMSESNRLFSFQGPKLSQVSDTDLRDLVRCALEVEASYAKLQQGRENLITNMKEMRDGEERELERLAQEMSNPQETSYPPVIEQGLNEIRRFLEHRRRMRELTTEGDKIAAGQFAASTISLDESPHMSHPYAAPVIAPTFNPSVPPPPPMPGMMAMPSMSIPPPMLQQPPPVTLTIMGDVGPTALPVPPLPFFSSLPPINMNVPPPIISRPPPSITSAKSMVKLTIVENSPPPLDTSQPPPVIMDMSVPPPIHSLSATVIAPPSLVQPSLSSVPPSDLLPPPQFEPLVPDVGLQAIFRALGTPGGSSSSGRSPQIHGGWEMSPGKSPARTQNRPSVASSLSMGDQPRSLLPAETSSQRVPSLLSMNFVDPSSPSAPKRSRFEPEKEEHNSPIELKHIPRPPKTPPEINPVSPPRPNSPNTIDENEPISPDFDNPLYMEEAERREVESTPTVLPTLPALPTVVVKQESMPVDEAAVDIMADVVLQPLPANLDIADSPPTKEEPIDMT